MKRFSEFCKEKGFYIALSTGIVAFAGLMIMYNYKSKEQKMIDEQAIDLNQPVISDEIEEQTTENSIVADEKEKVITKEQEEENKEVEQVSSNAAMADPNHEEVISQEEYMQNESTSNTALTSNGEEIVAGLSYEGADDLVWPVYGNVILPYSMDTTVYFKTLNAYKCNPAMLIGADEGTDVFAAYEGVVKDITDTKEYGTVVTLDMGNGYEAKYGQLMNVTVGVGDVVSTAGLIGEVAPVSSYFEEEGANLYFQILKDNEPINPMSLISQ